MNPRICSCACGTVGITSATGFPNRVTRTGLRVLRTFSSTARQVALNFEIGISFMRAIVRWSMIMVEIHSRRTDRADGADDFGHRQILIHHRDIEYTEMSLCSLCLCGDYSLSSTIATPIPPAAHT